MAEDTKVAAPKVAAPKTEAPKAAESKTTAAKAAPPAVAGDDPTDMEEMKKKFKPKKKVALPADMLSDAKSYDDKLMLVKMLTDKERNRMILIVKNMLKGSVAPTKK